MSLWRAWGVEWRVRTKSDNYPKTFRVEYDFFIIFDTVECISHFLTALASPRARYVAGSYRREQVCAAA